jgi:hypothetical protein
MTKATEKKEAAATKDAEDTQTEGSSAPVWKTLHNRVQGAMWRYLQKDGKTRYTVSVSRSYKDEKGKWNSVHYFDRQDLKDIRSVCDEAENEIVRFEGED